MQQSEFDHGDWVTSSYHVGIDSVAIDDPHAQTKELGASTPRASEEAAARQPHNESITVTRLL
jgi:hypothetical protein